MGVRGVRAGVRVCGVPCVCALHGAAGVAAVSAVLQVKLENFHHMVEPIIRAHDEHEKQARRERARTGEGICACAKDRRVCDCVRTDRDPGRGVSKMFFAKGCVCAL